MSKFSTKELNTVYKKYFKEYFDKLLKQDGFYKKGSINFFRLNKLGMLENLNFQKYYNRMTVNYSILPIFCGVLGSSGGLGGRIGFYFNGKDYWWKLESEVEIEKSMSEILEIIKKDVYSWFSSNNSEDSIFNLISKSYAYTVIYRYIAQATISAKLKKYDEILFYTLKVRKEYDSIKARGIQREWLLPILEEALLLEEKLKEGHQAVDEYIIEREKQSLRELGLEKLIKE